MGVGADFDGEYARVIAQLPAFGVALESLTAHLLEAHRIQVHRVEHRVKSKASTELKVARKVTPEGGPRAVESFTDMLGLRVITYFRDEVDRVAKVIEREFAIDEENSIDKRAVLDPDRFGYLSLHYVAQLSQSRAALGEYQQYAGIKFEIQIRSILQHAWAVIEHDLGYKSEAAVPGSVRRRFSRLAGLLELADDEFVAIREDVDGHQAAARQDVRKGALGIEIDQDSLTAFVQSSEQIALLDHVIAKSMNGTVRSAVDEEFIGRQAAQLVELHFRTIKELDDYIRANDDLLAGFIDRRLSLIRHTPRSRRTPVPRGIALYYVGMLRYAQDLLAGHAAASVYAGINHDSLLESLLSASADERD
jgi:putative GTP pyrophosphokinase